MKMTNDATIEWIIMTCKGICIRHKAPRPVNTVIVILLGRNDVKYVRSS